MEHDVQKIALKLLRSSKPESQSFEQHKFPGSANGNLGKESDIALGNVFQTSALDESSGGELIHHDM